MEDKTLFECIRNVVAKYGCTILQLHIQVRSELVQMRIKMLMIPPTNISSCSIKRKDYQVEVFLYCLDSACSKIKLKIIIIVTIDMLFMKLRPF